MCFRRASDAEVALAINYDGRVFRGVSNSENGEVDGSTLFVYEQRGKMLEGSYSGGSILQGHLIGSVNDDDTLDFVYHHVNEGGENMAGRCHSTPETKPEGRLVLHESWQWLTGDNSSGTSVVAEVDAGTDTPHDRVTEITVDALRTQYDAALATLEEAIGFFPEPEWHRDHPDDPVDRVVFHTLFFADYYLGQGPEGIRNQTFHRNNHELFQDYEELKDRPPRNHYERDACRRYLGFCRDKSRRTLRLTTKAALMGDSGFPRRNMSRLALHIYTIRHIQHHAAQLGLRHQLGGGRALTWRSQ